MTTSLFQVLMGLNIDGVINFVHGSGAPTSASTVGSIYLDNTNGIVYVYNATGDSGNPGWIPVASESYVQSQITQALSTQLTWRPPVEVVDTTLTTVPVGTANQTITVDSTIISNNQRVLFAALTTDPNVYIYDETTGLFTQDVAVQAGDTVYVITSGTQYTYSEQSVSWVLSNLTTVDELQYIRNFIGKLASGATTPNYLSTDVVTQGANIVDAVSSLDAAFGPETTDTLTYTIATGSVRANIASLDVALHNISTSSNSLTGYSTFTATTTGTSTVETISNVTSGIVKWMVMIVDSTVNATTSMEVMALVTDGTSLTYTTYGQLNTNNVIPGLEVTVAYSGTNVLLQVTSDDIVTVVYNTTSMIIG